MFIGILGTGQVAQTLARALSDAGHDVALGSRDPQSKTLAFPVLPLAETVTTADVVINATRGSASLETLTTIGADVFAGKIVLDVANANTPAFDLLYPNSSLGEHLQAALPDARIVKTMNRLDGRDHRALGARPEQRLRLGRGRRRKRDRDVDPRRPRLAEGLRRRPRRDPLSSRRRALLPVVRSAHAGHAVTDVQHHGGPLTMSAFNNKVIEEFRQNNGRVDSAGFGTSLVLIHSTGARTGVVRVNPAMSIVDDGGWLVIASAAGAPKKPGWYFNLTQHPDATIETASGDVEARAVELDGAKHLAAWSQFTARSRSFQLYQDRAGDRRLPIVRLEPRHTTQKESP